MTTKPKRASAIQPSARRWLLVLVVIVFTSLSACVPCGCDEATMDEITRQIASEALGTRVSIGKLTFVSPFVGDDTFTLTVVRENPTPPPDTITEQVSGTLKKSGDTIVFTIQGGTSRILQTGVQYTLVCSDKKLTLKRAGAPDLTFDCP